MRNEWRSEKRKRKKKTTLKKSSTLNKNIFMFKKDIKMNSVLVNRGEIESFLNECGENRKIRLSYMFNEKVINSELILKRKHEDNTLFVWIYAVAGCRATKYVGRERQTAGELNGKSIKNVISYMVRNPIFVEIECNVSTYELRQICVELSKAGKITYQMLAEDKRSGSNLFQLTSIDGVVIVNESKRNNLVWNNVEAKREWFYPKIIALFQELKSIDDVERLMYCDKTLKFAYQ